MAHNIVENCGLFDIGLKNKARLCVIFSKPCTIVCFFYLKTGYNGKTIHANMSYYNIQKRVRFNLVYVMWEFPCKDMLYYTIFFTHLQQKITSFEYFNISMSKDDHWILCLKTIYNKEKNLRTC